MLRVHIMDYYILDINDFAERIFYVNITGHHDLDSIRFDEHIFYINITDYNRININISTGSNWL